MTGKMCRSLNFHDFIAKCLTKDLKSRPTANELLEVRNPTPERGLIEQRINLLLCF